MMLRATLICPREQNEKRHEKYTQTTEQFQKQFHQDIQGPLSDFYIATLHLVHADSPMQSVPRALTSLKAMWLLDLRECSDESQQKDKRDNPVKKSSKRMSVIQTTRTHRSLNTKTR
jgi:hypothetical protein